MSDLMEIMINHGFEPRRGSSANGGEYYSACPFCGDGEKGKRSDRFHIWPDKPMDGHGHGRFWCRRCGADGDNIAFWMKLKNVNFPQACADLGIILPQGNGGGYRSRYKQPPKQKRNSSTVWKPRTYPEPNGVWQEKATKLLDDCQQRLANEQDAIAWLEARGLTRSVIDTYKLGFNQSSKNGDRYRPRKVYGLPPKKNGKGQDKRLWLPKGWVVPMFGANGQLLQLRIRRLDEDIAKFAGNIKYLPIDGSSSATMVLHPNADVFVVVESGLDAILLAGLMAGKIGVITGHNNSARPDVRAHGLLQRSSCILGGLDYDDGGDGQQEWWQHHYQQYRRLPAFGAGIGDPGEAYKAGVDLQQWIVDGLPKGLQIKLGFSRSSKPKVQPIKPPSNDVIKEEIVKEEKQATAPALEQDSEPDSMEIEMEGGRKIFVTESEAEWHRLTAQDKVVYSKNELTRVQPLMSDMDDTELAKAVDLLDGIKECFGGYVGAYRPKQEQ